jgi:hypothetical protein
MRHASIFSRKWQLRLALILVKAAQNLSHSVLKPENTVAVQFR